MWSPKKHLRGEEKGSTKELKMWPTADHGTSSCSSSSREANSYSTTDIVASEQEVHRMTRMSYWWTIQCFEIVEKVEVSLREELDRWSDVSLVAENEYQS